jgi:2-isopropylmalate synthase
MARRIGSSEFGVRSSEFSTSKLKSYCEIMDRDEKIIIFDTTLRDGELMPGVRFNLEEKIEIARLLEAIGIDIIEVSYPANSVKDFDEIVAISQTIERSIICGLASSNPDEILRVAEGIKSASRGRIHTYTPVRLKDRSRQERERVISEIAESVSMARNYCPDVEWSAFDATRSEPDFLCRVVEVAIANGATTINIPDTMGLASPAEFTGLIQMLFNRVPNIDRAVVSVHCHDDLGMAVDNSIAALNFGVRQVECAINGLGARKGNADLEKIVTQIDASKNYQTDIDSTLISDVSKLVDRITKKKRNSLSISSSELHS